MPDDHTLVIERCTDELGDWRVCLLSSLGSRVHAPWAMAVTARIRNQTGLDVEVMWGDDGFVVRFPDTERPPRSAAAAAGRGRGRSPRAAAAGLHVALRGTVPRDGRAGAAAARRRPGARTPLWRQRKKASDLLAVASRFGSFPALLETYRELLRDYFDMAALVDILRRIESRATAVRILDSRAPSPFAASLLFNYVANYIYDGDAPLAERRAQALSVDQAQLRELVGDAELRDLLDPEALIAVERQLQHLDATHQARTVDAVHDMLIHIGDLTFDEVVERTSLDARAVLDSLAQARRIVELPVAGQRRYVAIEDVSRYRDALGAPLPPGLPESLLEPVRDAAGDLAMRYARAHAPFTAQDLAARYGLGTAMVEGVLRRLTDAGRLVEGEFRPGGTEREWVDANVLRSLRRRSLAKLRREVEAVDADAFGRFTVAWRHRVAAQRARGAARRGGTAARRTDPCVGARTRRAAGARGRLPARHARHADGRGRNRVGRARTPRRARRTRGGMSSPTEAARLRAPVATPPPLAGRPAEVRVLRRHGASCSSHRSGAAPVTAFRRTRWTQSGRSCGRAS